MQLYTQVLFICARKKEREKEIPYALDVIFFFKDLVHVC